MSFHEVRFPEFPDYGTKGGPGFSTSIIELDSGAEVRIGRWSSARRKFYPGYSVRSRESIVALHEFYLARQGALYGFRYKDFTDFTTAPNGLDAPSNDDVEMLVAPGASTTMQLIKKYTSGGVTHTRVINKPVAGTTVLSKNGAPFSSGWSVDNTTGVVTFSPALTPGDVIGGGCEFDVPVRFGQGSDQLLSISIDDFSNFSAESLELVELKDGLVAPEEMNFGGCGEDGISGDISIGFGEGRVRVIRPASAGLACRLPNPGLVNPLTGGSFFYVINDSPTHALLLKDHLGTTLATIAVGECVECLISHDGSNVAYWYAR